MIVWLALILAVSCSPSGRFVILQLMTTYGLSSLRTKDGQCSSQHSVDATMLTGCSKLLNSLRTGSQVCALSMILLGMMVNRSLLRQTLIRKSEKEWTQDWFARNSTAT